jgi:hypothetical protein
MFDIVYPIIPNPAPEAGPAARRRVAEGADTGPCEAGSFPLDMGFIAQNRRPPHDA